MTIAENSRSITKAFKCLTLATVIALSPANGLAQAATTPATIAVAPVAASSAAPVATASAVAGTPGAAAAGAEFGKDFAVLHDGSEILCIKRWENLIGK